MLKMEWFELIAKGIPEGLLDVLMLFLLTNTRITLKNYTISSILFIISTFIIRLLPINVFIHTMIALIPLILIFIVFNKAETSLVIKSALFLTISIVVCELLNVLMLIILFKDFKDIEILLSDPHNKTIYGIPSTVILGIIVLVIFIIKKRKGMNRNGETS